MFIEYVFFTHLLLIIIKYEKKELTNKELQF